MKDLSLETLTAYVDNELDDTQRREVAEAVLRDSALRATVDRLRASRVLLSQAFSGVIDAPVPERLLQTLALPGGDAYTPPHDTPYSDNVVALHAPPQTRRQWMPLALAASVSLCVGLLVGFMVKDAPQPSSANATANLLQEVLETRPSGYSFTAADGQTTITSLSSFRTQDGRICREFEQRGNGLQSTGIACRNDEGPIWQTQIQITTSPTFTDAHTGTGYSPASGAVDPLEGAFERLGAGPALDASEEAQLLGNQWR